MSIDESLIEFCDSFKTSEATSKSILITYQTGWYEGAKWMNIMLDKIKYKTMKEIKEMEVDELRKEMDELWQYLYMTRETSTYHMFDWNGLDYWDADRRHYKISQEVLGRIGNHR